MRFLLNNDSPPWPSVPVFRNLERRLRKPFFKSAPLSRMLSSVGPFHSLIKTARRVLAYRSRLARRSAHSRSLAHNWLGHGEHYAPVWDVARFGRPAKHPGT